MKLLPYLLIILSSLALSSCLAELKEKLTGLPAASPETTESVAEQPEESAWDWQKFPLQNELQLGTMPVDVHPKKSLEIKAEASGIISVKVGEQISQVTKGALWAEMNSERLANKRLQHDIRKNQQNIEKIKIDEIELPMQEKEALEKLQEAKKKVELIKKVLSSEVMDEMLTIIGVPRSDISQDSLVQAEEALTLANKRFEFAQKHERELRYGQEKLDEMDLVESEKQLQEAKDQSQYYIPFDGELRINIPSFTYGQQEYSVVTREAIGTLSDYSEIYAHLKVQNAGWISLEPSTLRLRLKDRARTELPFLGDRNIKDTRGRDERNYIFNIALQDNQDLRRLTGSTLDADLLHKLDQPCHIVPKLQLSLYAMERTNKREWAVILQDLFPNAELVAEGLEHLAVHLNTGASHSAKK